MRATNGRHPRSPAAETSLQLARDYLAARRALWAAGGVSFRARLRLAAPASAFAQGDDSPAAFEAAAVAADAGFAISRHVPSVERELKAAIRARNALVESTFGLVQRYANRRGQGQGRDSAGLRLHADAEDLFQGAAEMLMRAADKFDPERGTAWSTYAVWWIRLGAQLEEIAAPAVRVPKRALTAWRQAEALRARVAAETGRELSWAEVCEALGKPASHVAVLEGVARALRGEPAVPEFEEINALAGTRLAEACREVAGLAAVSDPQPSPEDEVARAEVLDAVRALIDGAEPGERATLEGLAGERPPSLERIAREAGQPRSKGPEIRARAVEGARRRLARVA